MNILLLNPSWGGRVRAQRYNRGWPPLDLLNLASLLQRQGHRVRLADARAGGLSPAALPAFAAQADRVVVTSSPLDRWQCPNLDLAPLVAWTRAVPQQKLILSGVHGTLFPAEMMRLTGARTVLVGEPESAGPALFSALSRREDAGETPGVSWCDGKDVYLSAPAPPFDLSKMPPPAYSLVHPERYEYELLGGKLALLETARGCPHRCIFCLKAMYGQKIRFKSPAQVAAEVESILGLGFRTVYFIDLEFTMDRDRTLALCEALRSYPLTWCCQTRADAVDPDLLDEMRKSGCRLIHYGIESGSERVRHLVGKPLSNERIERAIAWTKKAGMAAAGFFLLGFAGETESERRQTARFARTLPLSYASFHRVTPYPGTELGRIDPQPPWWEKPLAAKPRRPGPAAMYLQFYLRPAYFLEFLRTRTSALKAMRLFCRFLCGTRSARPGD